MDEGATKTNPTTSRRSDQDLLLASDPDRLAFDETRLSEYLLSRPKEVLARASYLASVAFGIWWAWQRHSSSGNHDRSHLVGVAEDDGYSATLKQVRPETKRGKALRDGLANMGVFFVKCGQTLSQRPDLVGGELAEELKGLQERNAPFDDAVAHRIIAEDLGCRGPLAPGVLWDGCDTSAPPLLAEMDPQHVASASLGQVYRGRCHDGREVALKVQRPGIGDVIGLDWAVAVLACKGWVTYKRSLNDYAPLVDTVAKGIRMELDYHNEAANLEEFAARHAFLPFVASPGWIPELTGPVGSARVLCMDWYPSRAPSELNKRERRELVQMAVEACVVQLLITGFVHADPHEGNLRLGDDGRLVFLDFGLMDRVDFGVMEGFAAGIRCVLSQDWLQLTKIFQEVRFAPTPLLKRLARGGVEECDGAEFAAVLGRTLVTEEGGSSRFGALATALKKISPEYVMLVPPYVALLCRTFITLEGLLGEDVGPGEEFNIYEVALPFAVRRVLSPRTRRGQATLRGTLLSGEDLKSRGRRRHARPVPKWDTFAALLEAGESGEPSAAGALEPDQVDLRDPFGASAAVQRRLLRTTEGAALRRCLYEVDVFDALRRFLVSPAAKPFRSKVVEALAVRWAVPRLQKGQKHAKAFGPRSEAACEAWGQWREEEPYQLPPAALRASRAAWRIVARRQVRYTLWPPWRLGWRATAGLGQILLGIIWLSLQASLRAAALRRQRSRED